MGLSWQTRGLLDTITRGIEAYAIWSSYWSTFPLEKKSWNQEINIHSILYPLIHSNFPITFRPIRSFHHWRSNRAGKNLKHGEVDRVFTAVGRFLHRLYHPFSINQTWTTTPAPTLWPSWRLNQEPAEEAANDNPNTGKFEFGSAKSEGVSILLSTDLQSQPNSTHSLVMHARTTFGGATRISDHGRRPESPKRWWKQWVTQHSSSQLYWTERFTWRNTMGHFRF